MFFSLNDLNSFKPERKDIYFDAVKILLNKNRFWVII